MSRFQDLEKSFESLRKRAGAGVQAELYAVESESLDIAHHQGKLDKYAFSASHAASVRVITSGNEGYASTEDLSEKSLNAVFDQALANAKLLSQSSYEQDFELPKSDPSLVVEAPTSRLASLSPEEKIAIALRIESTALAADKRIKVVPYSGYSEGLRRRYVFNTHGVALSDEQSSCELNCFPLAEENGASKMSYSPSLSARDPRDLKPEEYADQSARRSLAKLNPVMVNSGRYLCVFSSLALESFFGPIDGMIAGSSIFEKTSAFSDKLEKSVGSNKLTILNDPLYPASLHSYFFDAEGSPTQKFSLIKNGIFQTPLTNARWARKLGLKNSASAARGSAHGQVGLSSTNRVVEAGATPFKNLLNQAPKILLINEMEGFAGYNRITGNFSLPSSGFLVENGEIKQPIDNFLVSGNIFDFLAKIVDIGSDLQSARGEIFTPSMLISDVSIAGK